MNGKKPPVPGSIRITEMFSREAYPGAGIHVKSEWKMDLRPFARKKIIIKPAYQIKLAVTFFVYIAIYSLILGFIIFYPLYQDLNAATSLEEQTMLSSMVLYLHKRVWAGFLLVAVLAGVHALFSSHKLVGPMYRFEKMAQELIRGNYGMRIKIRKGDEFKEMEGYLNRLAEGLDLTKTRNAQFYADTKIRLETIRAMLEAEGAEYPAEVKRLTHDLIQELNSRDPFHR